MVLEGNLVELELGNLKIGIEWTLALIASSISAAQWYLGELESLNFWPCNFVYRRTDGQTAYIQLLYK